MRWGVLLLALVLWLGCGPLLYAQYDGLDLNQPRRVRYGASLGTGGVHVFLKPSFDLEYNGATARLAPGLFFLSMQLSLNLMNLRDHDRRQPIPLFLSLGFHDDWLLGKSLWARRNTDLPQRRNLQLHTGMLGFRYRLDPLGYVYWEVSGGAMLARERFHPLNGRKIEDQTTVYPMIELRLGGFLQFHKHDRPRWPGPL